MIRGRLMLRSVITGISADDLGARAIPADPGRGYTRLARQSRIIRIHARYRVNRDRGVRIPDGKDMCRVKVFIGTWNRVRSYYRTTSLAYRSLKSARGTIYISLLARSLARRGTNLRRDFLRSNQFKGTVLSLFHSWPFSFSIRASRFVN